MDISYFEFKMRLIKLGLSFQKQKSLYSNSQLTDSQSGVMTITPKSQLWVGDIKLIQYKMGKTRIIALKRVPIEVKATTCMASSTVENTGSFF